MDGPTGNGTEPAAPAGSLTVTSVVQSLAGPVSKMISEGPAYGLMLFGGVMLLFTILGESGVLILGAGMSGNMSLAIVAVGAVFMLAGALIQMTENARTRQFTFELTQTALQASQSGAEATLEAIAAASDKRETILLEALRAAPPPPKPWG
jgi:hypothetical protein